MTINPGLDVRALQALRRNARDLDLLCSRIREHLDQHEGYLAFSGGKDSLVVLHLALQVDPQLPVAFFDSGAEFPETYDYLEQLRSRWGLNLHIYRAEPGAVEILANGGRWDHRADASTTAEIPGLHQALIVEPSRRAHLDHGAGELWGVRARESRGRAAAYSNALRAAQCDCSCSDQTFRVRHGGVIERVDQTVAFGPIWDWSDEEVWGYLARCAVPTSPVYEKLRRLGAPDHFLRVSTLVDGARLEEGRISWLQRGWPGLFAELAIALPRLREYV